MTCLIIKMSDRHGKKDYVLPIRKVVLQAIAVQIVASKKKTVSAQQLKDFKEDYPWITRNQVNWYVKEEQSKPIEVVGKGGDTVENEKKVTSKEFSPGGRPSGTTKKRKHDLKAKLTDAKNRIAHAVMKAKDSCSTGSLKMGQFKSIHDKVMQRVGLDGEGIEIKPSCIRVRLHRGVLDVDESKNHVSPVKPIEKVLIQYVIWKQNAGQPMTTTECVELANSLIEGTEVEKSLIKWQKNIKKSGTGRLTKKYIKLFLNRNSLELAVSPGSKRDARRTLWSTYENIEKMYDLVYKQMVLSGVAQDLPEDRRYYVNQHNRQTNDVKQAYGKLIDIEIVNPDWILFGDEVGCNINMREDGRVGQQTFAVASRSSAEVTCSSTDGRFTLIGLTAASGDPVMCVIIFAADELTFEQRMGFDVTVGYDDHKTIEDNVGPNKTFPGAPTCYFKGRTIPPLVCCSPKGSITSVILRTIFERLDDIGVYDRKSGVIPFALFDAHDSRLQLPFMKYINDEKHLWKFCIGLPNATHLWQVGDSNEQNGTFKTKWYSEKSKLVLYRTRKGLSPALVKSDIIPLINKIWPVSFGRKYSNKNAISARGWYPPTRKLLTDPSVLKTRSKFKNVTENVGNLSDSSIEEVKVARRTRSKLSSTGNKNKRGQMKDPDLYETDNDDIEENQPEKNKRGRLKDPKSYEKVNLESICDSGNSDWANDSDYSESPKKCKHQLTTLNFKTGIANDFTLDILQHLVRSEFVKKDLHDRYADGKRIRKGIDATKRLTGGVLFKANKIFLDDEVLNIRKEKEIQKKKNLQKTISSMIIAFKQRYDNYIAVINKKSGSSKISMKDMKTVLAFKKMKGDKAMPTTLALVTERYDKVLKRNRPDYTIVDFMTERGYYNEEDGSKEMVDELTIETEENIMSALI